MQLLGILSSFIYIISSALLLPVLFLLSALSLVVLYKLGAFFAEYLSRLRVTKEGADVLGQCKQAYSFSPASKVVMSFLVKLQVMERLKKATEVEVEYFLQETALGLRRSLDFIEILVRVGPMLGLMGTLIPMGTGLAALSQGDLTKLSSDLVIAFTTTVVGLAQGGISYAILRVKKRWVEKDILQMEYIAEQMVARQS
jgi:biopolymer transport protein ExbB/TolQ